MVRGLLEGFEGVGLASWIMELATLNRGMDSDGDEEGMYEGVAAMRRNVVLV